MKKNRKSLWKKTALLLSAALLAGMAAENGSDLERVYAAGGTPSVTSFATKDELKTKFDCDGVGDTVGRLRFGKNAYGEPQIWYIAGTDSGIKRDDGMALVDNIVLFAAEPILGKSKTDGTTIGGQKFAPDEGPISYEEGWGCTYDTPPSKVNQNHYGRSELRAKLQEIAKSCFTQAEQSLMNATPVKTWDTFNNVTYTTTDKLYALSIEDVNKCYIGEDLPNDITKIYAGSDNKIVISSEVYRVDPLNQCH